MERERSGGGLQPFKHDGGNLARAQDFFGIENLDADQFLACADVQGDFIGEPHRAALVPGKMVSLAVRSSARSCLAPIPPATWPLSMTRAAGCVCCSLGVWPRRTSGLLAGAVQQRRSDAAPAVCSEGLLGPAANGPCDLNAQDTARIGQPSPGQKALVVTCQVSSGGKPQDPVASAIVPPRPLPGEQ